MMQKSIALVGISGVGKTTFLKRLASEIEFQHLTAGTLISAGKALEQQDRDQLRMSNIDENQQLLIAGFHHAKDKAALFVVMDGHVVIHTEQGLKNIGADVFDALGIDAMVHLVADPMHIFEHRTRDTSRNRPTLSEQQLKEHQDASLLAAQEICKSINIPFMKITADEIDTAKQFFLFKLSCKSQDLI